MDDLPEEIERCGFRASANAILAPMTVIDQFRITKRSPYPQTVVDLPTALATNGPWLAIVPHDDDLVIGMGLVAMAAIAAGIELHVAVVSDGCMGYATVAERAGIVARRRAEMEASCVMLGLPASHIHWLGFPDGDLPSWQGCRAVTGQNDPVGIARSLTATMRRVRPTLVFGPTATDIHPDHRVVASELDIACFHASGVIWLELGAPIALPRRWDYAVYCPFPQPPAVELRATSALFTRKLDAIAAFASQEQIAALVARMRAAGPVEYLREVTWEPYHPGLYAGLFTVVS